MSRAFYIKFQKKDRSGSLSNLLCLPEPDPRLGPPL
jgi:hypothetical protein